MRQGRRYRSWRRLAASSWRAARGGLLNRMLEADLFSRPSAWPTTASHGAAKAASTVVGVIFARKNAAPAERARRGERRRPEARHDS